MVLDPWSSHVIVGLPTRSRRSIRRRRFIVNPCVSTAVMPMAKGPDHKEQHEEKN